MLLGFGLTEYFYCPEIKGYILEQIAEIFDVSDALVTNPVEDKSGSSTLHNQPM